MTTKICTKCKISKDISNFSKNKNYKDGYQNQCKDCFKQYTKDNKKILSEKKKIYNKQNEDKIKEYRKKHYSERKEYYLEYHRNNKDKRNKRRKIKRKNDPNYRLIHNLRTRLHHALNGQNKSKSTLELLGCSIGYLKEHLQQTAIDNGYLSFNINDYCSREYHIDHIIPCDAFDLSTHEEQQKCFNWSNLQILTAKINMSKSNKI